MKKLLSLVVVIFVVFGVYGQEKESKGLDRKYVVKFMPVNYLLQSYSFEIERMISGKNAITLGIGIPNNQSLIGKYGIESPAELTELKLGTMHIRAAYRHYAGKSRLPRGFYIEPYLKYQQIKFNGEGQYTDNGTTYNGKLDANLSTLNAGFQMGIQLLLAKRISLDFYFLGIEAGMLNGNIIGTPPPEYVSDFRDEIEKNIADLPKFLGDKLTVTSTTTTVNVKASSIPYPWIRGGVSIGIAF